MGDLRNSRARLKTLLKSVQYPHLHTTSLESASVQDLLRILHFALLDYSRAVAAFVQSKGYDLYGKTDARFVDSAFRLLRDEFKYFPSLNSTQFLSQHFWERKLNLVSDILQLVLTKHDESVWLKRQQDAVWSKPKESKGAPTRIENHILPSPSQEKAPSHALTVLQFLRQNQSKTRAQRLKEAEAADRNRKISAESASSPERLSSERRQGNTRSASSQRSSSEQNGVTHARKVTFDSFDSYDQQDDRAFNHFNTSHEFAIENGDVDTRADTLATTHHIEQAAARPSASNNADLAETLAALSSQIAGLSSAFMTKISSVEERLSRLESQMQTLSDQTQEDPIHHQQHTKTTSPHADVTDAGDNNKENEREASSTGGSYSSSNGHHHVQSEAASRLRVQIESCSWPPKPSVFVTPQSCRTKRKMKSSEGEADSDDGVEWMDDDDATAAAAAASSSTTATTIGVDAAEDDEEEFEYSEEELEEADEVDWEDVAETPRSSAATQSTTVHTPAATEPQRHSDYAEAIADDASSSSGDDASADGDDDGDEIYEPDVEAMDDDSDDDYESDGNGSDEQVLTNLQKINWEQVNQVLQQEAQKAAKKEKNKKKRKAVMRMSKADKERELTLHQSHLLLLLAMQLKWNALCQSPVLRGLLLSITSSGAFDFYAEMKRHPLKYSLEMLVRWYNQHFHVLSASEVVAHNDDSGGDDSGPNGTWSELVTEARLMQVFFDRKGRDYELAVLFTALCRALRLYCRHTCALDALLVQQTKAFEASSAASPVSGNSRSRKRSRTQSGTPRAAEQDQVVNTEIMSTQSFWVWTEVYDEKKRVWVHVDAIRKLVGQPREIEALRGKGAPFSYVVGVTSSDRLVDVTPRYAAKWSKSLRFRIADEWMGGALEVLSAETMGKRLPVVGYDLFKTSTVDQDEEKLLADEKAKLLAMTESEEMPTSIEAFKKHHLYCLERHLGRFECIYPRKAVGIFNGQPVFLKKHVQVTRSAYQWLRLGREVKDSERETPVKWYKKGGKQAHGYNGGVAQDSDSDDNDNTGDNGGAAHATNRDGARAMFGVWQTSAFVPPPVVNGVVPKNSYGNIEIWSAAHVPRHGVHVQLPRIEKVAQQLGVDFAPAVVGFEIKDDRNVPKFDGIVVAESALELLTDAHAHMQQSTIEKAIEKNQQLIAKRWERLVRRLLLRQRLEDDYGSVAKASRSS